MYIMFLDVTHQHSDKKWVPQSRSPKIFFAGLPPRTPPKSENGDCHFANPPLTRALAGPSLVAAAPAGAAPPGTSLGGVAERLVLSSRVSPRSAPLDELLYDPSVPVVIRGGEGGRR